MSSEQPSPETPFSGVKIADFSQVLAGPITSKHLADYGATVIRVESARRPDACRTSSPFKDGKPGLNRSGYYNYFNANKYSLALDMNHPKALPVARRLVSWADVVIESFRPGIMERWKLGYEEVRAIKPDIIMLRSSNQGQTGPSSSQPGLGAHLNGLIGMINVTGWQDREPSNLMLAYTDYITPFLSAAAIIAALDHRRKTGQGQLLDVSQFEAGLQFFLPGVVDYIANGNELSRNGNACPDGAPHGAYRCKGDDRWVAIGVFTDGEWQSFCRVTGHPEWARDARFLTLSDRKTNEDQLDRLVEAWTEQHAPEEVMRQLQEGGVAAGVVQSPKEVFEDPQLRERGFFWQLEHPETGPFHHLGQSARLSRTPAVARLPAPCLGEHTEFVCREILGMSEEDFDSLLVDRIFE